jgi:hypothetical protein
LVSENMLETTNMSADKDKTLSLPSSSLITTTAKRSPLLKELGRLPPTGHAVFFCYSLI